MSYIGRIENIANHDVAVLHLKDMEYGGSWLKRGGVGAFMMLARKWDRLETAMERVMEDKSAEGYPAIDKYDIIKRAVLDGREEGILDDIGDMRRYLLLVEGEIHQQESQRSSTNFLGTCYDEPSE